MRTLSDVLSPPYLRLAPELAGLSWPSEPLATCSSCAMQREVPGRIRFAAKAKCCTYQPRMPNFSVGGALRRGGIGAERMRARLADPRGIEARGVAAPPRLASRYVEGTWEFGQDDALTCPYWVEGPLGCSVHEDRNAVCRTWFCKSPLGATGAAAWMALKELLRSIEHTYAEICVLAGHPPEQGASVEDWADWYVWCAGHVESLDDAALATLRGERLEQLLGHVHARVAERDGDLPDILTPRIQSWVPFDDHFDMTAWSAFDMVSVPKWIFVFLSKLDGERTWFDARAEAERELGFPIEDDLVVTLWRRGLLGPPQDLSGLPVNPTIEFPDEPPGY